MSSIYWCKIRIGIISCQAFPERSLRETFSKKEGKLRMSQTFTIKKHEVIQNARWLKRAFMTYIETLAICNPQELSYLTARVSCPFLEARGNLEDASTGFICSFTATTATAVSNVPTWADCRNTGKRLNERIVASSERVSRSRGRMNVWQVIKGFFSRPCGDMHNGYISAHVETCHEKKIDFELYSGKLDGQWLTSLDPNCQARPFACWVIDIK